MLPPDLTDTEVNEICQGLKQPAAQVRYLTALGLRVARRPNGRPLVNRAHYNAVRSGGSHVVGAQPAWSRQA